MNANYIKNTCLRIKESAKDLARHMGKCTISELSFNIDPPDKKDDNMKDRKRFYGGAMFTEEEVNKFKEEFEKLGIKEYYDYDMSDRRIKSFKIQGVKISFNYTLSEDRRLQELVARLEKETGRKVTLSDVPSTNETNI